MKSETGTTTADTSRAAATRPKPDRAGTEHGKHDEPGLAARVAPNGAARQIAYLRQARALFQAFIDRAKDRPDMRDAVARSRERIEDIDKTIQFLHGTGKAASSQP